MEYRLDRDGPLRIDVLRDRAGSIEPLSIPTHERRLTGFDDIIIMYARGMPARLRPSSTAFAGVCSVIF